MFAKTSAQSCEVNLCYVRTYSANVSPTPFYQVSTTSKAFFFLFSLSFFCCKIKEVILNLKRKITLTETRFMTKAKSCACAIFSGWDVSGPLSIPQPTLQLRLRLACSWHFQENGQRRLWRQSIGRGRLQVLDEERWRQLMSYWTSGRSATPWLEPQ